MKIWALNAQFQSFSSRKQLVAPAQILSRDSNTYIWPSSTRAGGKVRNHHPIIGRGVRISAPIPFSCAICDCITVSYLNCWCGGGGGSAPSCMFVTSLAWGGGGGGGVLRPPSVSLSCAYWIVGGGGGGERFSGLTRTNSGLAFSRL